jgi:cyclophilin family peptidyl-prolyl cis-trans isomerase
MNFLSLCIGGMVNSASDKENLSYKGTIIHRVVKNGYIQGGDIQNIKGGKSIYNGEFADETYIVPHSRPGILGMVKKSGRKHSNECQFYITLTEMKSFDQMFVAFGRVIQGFKTIKEIENMEMYLQRPVKHIQVVGCGEFFI